LTVGGRCALRSVRFVEPDAVDITSSALDKLGYSIENRRVRWWLDIQRDDGAVFSAFHARACRDRFKWDASCHIEVAFALAMAAHASYRSFHRTHLPSTFVVLTLVSPMPTRDNRGFPASVANDRSAPVLVTERVIAERYRRRVSKHRFINALRSSHEHRPNNGTLSRYRSCLN